MDKCPEEKCCMEMLESVVDVLRKLQLIGLKKNADAVSWGGSYQGGGMVPDLV